MSGSGIELDVDGLDDPFDEWERIRALSPSAFYGEFSEQIRGAREGDRLDSDCEEFGFPPIRETLCINGQKVEYSERDFALMRIGELLRHWLSEKERHLLAWQITPEFSIPKGRPPKAADNAWRRDAEIAIRELATRMKCSLPKAAELWAERKGWPPETLDKILEFIGRAQRRK